MALFITQGGHRKTIKVIKVLRVKYGPVNGIANRIAKAHNNRCLLVRNGDHH